MQAERWRSCVEIFHAAIERPPGERAALLARSCNGNAALRSKVEVLLKYHDTPDEFIDTPAFAISRALALDDGEGLVGNQLGSYRIEAVLGAGGMGVVYRAYDERLQRTVALKLLPFSFIADETKLQRLQGEARMASALNHPNIVTIHEVGQADSTHYIATEFIEGVTLRERLLREAIAPNEALEIALQVASALSVAHRAGIVHRDVKPENIMLRPDGIVKVLDFGIAKSIEQTAPRDGVIGTKSYMSPEQRRGEAVGAGSDIWSFGVVLAEMLASVRPAAFQRIIGRCLRDAPADRYPNADALLGDLRAAKEKTQRRITRSVAWIGLSVAAVLIVSALSGVRRDPPLPNDKSIAVLPFQNLSAEPDAFLAAGLHDDVIISLAKIKDLKVIARDSVASYSGGPARGQLRGIGKSLGVAHLLQGTVRRAADRLVVNVALIDARTQQEEWAERYERDFPDALSLQGELAVEIAHQLRATLTPAEETATATKPTENAEAYLLYLRAGQIDLVDMQDGRAAAAIYQQAIDLDPAFALARARLSMCASFLTNWPPDPEWKAKARAEAEEALRLRPQMGEAHLALAQCFWAEEDYDRALGVLRRTAELLPNSAEVPLTAAMIYKRQNKWRERLAALERAEALDPRNHRVLGLLVNTRRWLRQWREAMQTADKLAVIAPEDVDCWHLGLRDEFQLSAAIEVLKRGLGSLGDADTLNLVRYEIAMFERDYAEATRHLAAVSPQKLNAHDFFVAHPKAFHEALLAVASGGEANAKRQALEAARADVGLRLVPRPGDLDVKRLAELALIDAFLGRKEDAIREASRALDRMLDGSIERNSLSAALAMVYAQTGEPEKALDLIEHLLTVPAALQCGDVYNMTLTDLKWRWQWDPLRSHPRFQKLLAGGEPKTVY
ncbi:MAG: protein kinase [Verrucomicrobiota bacterium]|nr:protein kinase [Verrucomicrobiota bacterium]